MNDLPETFPINTLHGATDVLPISVTELALPKHPKGRAFLFANVLSQSECDYYIQEAESLGLKKIASSSPDYRNNLRVVAISSDLAGLIFQRVKDFLPEMIHVPSGIEDQKLLGISPGFLIHGCWKISGMNDTFRLCKYNPGGHFGPHFDGNFIQSTKQRSFLTFMIYLNGNLNGGATNFISDQQSLFRDNEGLFRAEKNNVILGVPPKAGQALVFYHQIMHEGEKLLDGVKYIMRTDIMYTCMEEHLVDPKDDEAVRLYQTAENLESEKRYDEAAAYYRRSFKLSPALALVYGS